MKTEILRLKNRYKHYEKLCVNCIWGKATRSGKAYCHKTKSVPNFKYYCSEFRLDKKSEYSKSKMLKERKLDLVKVTQPENDYYQDIQLGQLYMILIGLLIAVLVAPFVLLYNFLESHYPLSAEYIIGGLIVVFFAFVISISLNKRTIYRLLMPNPFLGTNTHLPYYYLILALYLYKHKENSTKSDLKIIEQTIVQVFGQRYLKFASYFMKYGIKGEMNGKNFSRYIQKVDYEYRVLLFVLLTELQIFNNLKDYKTNNKLNEIIRILNITSESSNEIIGVLKENEKEYQEKLEEERRKAEEERRRQEAERRKAQQMFNFKKSSNYKVLGLTSGATNEEIVKRVKELALKYHPDRFVNDVEGQQKALVEFKKITEAYNYIRDERGI